MAYPFPIPGRPEPCFLTKHEAADLSKQYVAQRHMKKCWHLQVGEVVDTWEHLFFPSCAQHSFAIEPIDLAMVAPDDPDKWLFRGCPESCHFYRPAWRERLKVRAVKPFRVVAAIGRWFERQDPKLKMLVVLLALFIISPATVYAFAGAIAALAKSVAALKEAVGL